MTVYLIKVDSSNHSAAFQPPVKSKQELELRSIYLTALKILNHPAASQEDKLLAQRAFILLLLLQLTDQKTNNVFRKQPKFHFSTTSHRPASFSDIRYPVQAKNNDPDRPKAQEENKRTNYTEIKSAPVASKESVSTASVFDEELLDEIDEETEEQTYVVASADQEYNLPEAVLQSSSEIDKEQEEELPEGSAVLPADQEYNLPEAVLN